MYDVPSLFTAWLCCAGNAGLDILRLALLNESGCKYFLGDEDSGKVFLGELLALAV